MLSNRTDFVKAIRSLITCALVTLTTGIASADSIAIYKGRTSFQEVFRDTTVNKPVLRGHGEECYAVLRLGGGGGGEFAFVFFGKDKTGKHYSVAARSVVSLNSVTDAAGSKGQCALSRASAAANVNNNTIWNYYADGPLSSGAKDAAKLDRNWTRILSYEENFGAGYYNTDMNDYNYFRKGLLVMDNALSKTANTANGGAPESFDASLNRIKALLETRGYTPAVQ